MSEKFVNPEKKTEPRREFLLKGAKLLALCLGTPSVLLNACDEKIKKPEWYDENIPDVKRVEIQKKWMLEYLHSEKFLERAQKEIALDKKYTGGNIKKEVLKIQKQRIQNVASAETYFLKLPDDIIGRFIEKTEVYNYTKVPKGGVIIDTLQMDKSPATGVHEFTHRSTKQNTETVTSTNEFIKNWMLDRLLDKMKGTPMIRESEMNTLFDLSEMNARINAIRYVLFLMKKYDAKFQDFQNEHYEYLKNNFDRLFYTEPYLRFMFENLKKEDFIWLMNNIA